MHVPEWSLSDRLRKAREYAGLSQEALGEALELSERTIGRAEQGDGVQRTTVLAWAVVCGVDPQWLLTGVPTPK